jgi:hypothetical protein
MPAMLHFLVQSLEHISTFKVLVMFFGQLFTGADSLDIHLCQGLHCVDNVQTTPLKSALAGPVAP